MAVSTKPQTSMVHMGREFLPSTRRIRTATLMSITRSRTVDDPGGAGVSAMLSATYPVLAVQMTISERKTTAASVGRTEVSASATGRVHPSWARTLHIQPSPAVLLARAAPPSGYADCTARERVLACHFAPSC